MLPGKIGAADAEEEASRETSTFVGRQLVPTSDGASTKGADDEGEGGEGRFCRICFDGDDPGGAGVLIAPCQCAGSVRWVHRSCLDAWRLSGVNSENSARCEMCHAVYAFSKDARPGVVAGRWALLVCAAWSSIAIMSWATADTFVILPRIRADLGLSDEGRAFFGRWGLGLATNLWFVGLFSVVELLRGAEDIPARGPNWVWVARESRRAFAHCPRMPTFPTQCVASIERRFPFSACLIDFVFRLLQVLLFLQLVNLVISLVFWFLSPRGAIILWFLVGAYFILATLAINTVHLCIRREYQDARLGSIRPYLIPPETEPQVLSVNTV
jgi:hypothetical protein